MVTKKKAEQTAMKPVSASPEEMEVVEAEIKTKLKRIPGQPLPSETPVPAPTEESEPATESLDITSVRTATAEDPNGEIEIILINGEVVDERPTPVVEDFPVEDQIVSEEVKEN